jgi:hypothetical protein
VRRRLPAIAAVVGLVVVVASLEALHLAGERHGFSEVDWRALAYGAFVLLTTAAAVALAVDSFPRAAVLVGLAWTTLCAASMAKRRYLGAPLYPWDLLRMREVFGIWDELPVALRFAAIAAAASVVFAAAACVAPGIRTPIRERTRRIATGAALVVLLAAPFAPVLRAWAPGAGNTLSVALGLRNVRWWPELNYAVNGFTAGFLMSLDVLQIPKPDAAPFPLAPECASDPPPVRTVAASRGAHPDVVVLLLESVFDPTTLGVPLSRDPMPFMRTLMAASGHAELQSALWAHGTANAEFEILTGLSTAFLPPDSVVFFHYLHAPLDSLATELRRVGYRAEAVHPNPGWFYARTDAYRWLGFDRAWFRDDFVAPRDARGRMSDDRVFFGKLRELLAADDGPHFLWGVTLGTHGPYLPKRAPRCDLVVGSPAEGGARADGVTLESLRIYACLLERLDRRLAELVQWLEQRGRPTVLFAYGDHWPPLGADVDPYRITATGGAAGAGPRLSPTPLVLWSNTDAPLPRGYRGGFTFLGPAILRAAGVTPRCQFAAIEPLHARLGVVHAGLPRTGPDGTVGGDVGRYWALTHRLLLEGRR